LERKGFQIYKTTLLAFVQQPPAPAMTYAVLSLGRNAILTLLVALNGDSLLTVDGLARDGIDSGEQILFSTTSDKDTLVTMGLNNDLLAALGTAGSTTTAATPKSSALYNVKSSEWRNSGLTHDHLHHAHEHHHEGHHDHRRGHHQHHHGHRSQLDQLSQPGVLLQKQ